MLKIFCLYHKRQIRNNYEKKTIDMDRFDRSDYGKLRRKILNHRKNQSYTRWRNHLTAKTKQRTIRNSR